MVSALAPHPQPKGAANAAVEGASPQRMQPRAPLLTRKQERVLLERVHEARLLKRIRKRLLAETGSKSGPLPVSPQMWALEAGLGVDELQRRLKGGVEAKQTLVERNMPMVFKIVEQQYRWRLRDGHVSTADLVQEGAYALAVAADRFDPVSNQNRFLTYAVFIVRDKLDAAVAAGNMAISVPVAALKEFYSARRELTSELGRQPSELELERFFVDGVLDVSPSDSLPSLTSGVIKIGAMSRKSPVGGMGTEVSVSGAGVMESRLSAVALEALSARKRKRRLDLVAAVQRVSSIDAVIRGSDGSKISVVETLPGAFSHADPTRGVVEDDSVSALLPKVLTPRQAELVRLACGLVDGRPRTMQECSEKLCLSVAKTKTLFDASLEKLRAAATLDTGNPTLA